MMELRLARPEEAQVLWHIRNQAVWAGCAQVYDADTLIAFTPDTMPAGYLACITQNPFFVIADAVAASAVVADADADAASAVAADAEAASAAAAGGPVATGFLDIKHQSVEAIFTLPAYQGRGYAARILARIIHEANTRQMTRLTLSSTPNAVAFYLRQGFSEAGKSQYYSASARRYLPCVDMSLEL